LLVLTALPGVVGAQLLNPPPDVPPVDAVTAPAPATEEQVFTKFRHDLINLLVLRADAHLLMAAAQIAAPDGKDPSRLAAKKTPALLKRAQEYAPKDPLVLWVAASNACVSSPGCADPVAAKKLQMIDADNAAAWLLSYPADDNAQKARATVARMAQAQRFDDYWAADVVALFHALETLPVPGEVARRGVNPDAARINFATSTASTILPAALARLGKFCAAADTKDSALVSDCIAVARKFESGGTFISQAAGFAIEEALLAPGVDRDVMLTRNRAAIWQKEKFLQVSDRFAGDPGLAQGYVRLLGSAGNELATVSALLREQNIPSDPPADWQPPEAKPAQDPLTAPAVQH
ncbi:MAG: hypothetical protein ACREPT_14755, partial [Rudaea sp.]